MLMWEPQYGDLITRSRFFSWWGYVVGYDGSKEEVMIVRAANPHVLFNLSPSEADKRTITVDLVKIRKDSGYAALQVRNGQSIWFLS